MRTRSWGTGRAWRPRTTITRGYTSRSSLASGANGCSPSVTHTHSHARRLASHIRLLQCALPSPPGCSRHHTPPVSLTPRLPTLPARAPAVYHQTAVQKRRKMRLTRLAKMTMRTTPSRTTSSRPLCLPLLLPHNQHTRAVLPASHQRYHARLQRLREICMRR